ncbi:hypothetical protein D3C74_446600 [compost metagenome]
MLQLILPKPEIHGTDILLGVTDFGSSRDGDYRFPVIMNKPVQGNLAGCSPILIRKHG